MRTVRQSSFFFSPAVLLVWLALTSASAGLTSQDVEPVRVKLGMDTTAPGYEVTVPCFLEAPDDVQVGRIELEVTFEHDKVSFENVRPGLASDQIGAEVISEVQTSEVDPSLSVLKLSIAPGESVPIPPGFLLDLVFTINPELPIDSPSLVLNNSSRAYRFSDPPELLGNVQAQDGLIVVAAEPPTVATCFFYMH